MNFFELIPKMLLAPQSKARWNLLGANGRVLDITDSEVGNAGFDLVLPAPNTVGLPVIGTIFQAIAKNPANPEMVTIQASEVSIVSTDPNNMALPQMIITWGSGAARHVATVDIGVGTSVSVNASYVKVDAFFTWLAGPLGQPPVIKVTAGMAYGTRGGEWVGPTHTQATLGVLTTGSFHKEVPAFARTLTVLTRDRTTGLPADIKIEFEDNSGGTPRAMINQLGATNAGSCPCTVPVPAWARFVKYTNPGANTIDVSAIFGLAL